MVLGGGYFFFLHSLTILNKIFCKNIRKGKEFTINYGLWTPSPDSMIYKYIFNQNSPWPLNVALYIYITHYYKRLIYQPYSKFIIMGKNGVPVYLLKIKRVSMFKTRYKTILYQKLRSSKLAMNTISKMWNKLGPISGDKIRILMPPIVILLTVFYGGGPQWLA